MLMSRPELRARHRASHAHPVNIKPIVESLEPRLLFATDVRPINELGNNLANPTWGSTGIALQRVAPAQYANGVSTPAGSSRPSPRVISNTIAAHPEEEIFSATHLAAYAYLWGQFIDHDMDLTVSASPAQPFNVPVPKGDPQFDPTSTGTKVIPLNRSSFASGTGVTNPRQQVNQITAFLDGSMIYGSDATRAAALRSFVGGRLKNSDGDLLPFNTGGLDNANDAHIFPNNQLFIAGDVRANENAELTALHTLFMREHNARAGVIAKQHPSWTDEQIYQQARALVIGEIQNITYNEFLPALLGPNAIPKYTGYKPNVNPGISNEFSTAAFRLGHSMLADDVEFFTNDGEDVRPEMGLAEVFFNPSVVEENGIDPIIKYLASSNAEEIDNMVVNGVRNFLFGPPGAGGLDLASLNIQRGRDHGLADYNSTRAALGLPKVTSFSQITSNTAVAAKLQSLYGNVNNLDLWVGGLAENHVAGSNVGATFQKILVDQFMRLRDGDRFWYERTLSASDLSLVRSASLRSIIIANTEISNLQDNVFIFNTIATGKVFNDLNGNGRQDRNDAPLRNIVLQLVDEEGLVTATATTDQNGNYRFEGVQIGDFVVRPKLDASWSVTTNNTIDVTRGMTFTNVNCGMHQSQGAIGSQSMSSASAEVGIGLESDLKEILA